MTEVQEGPTEERADTHDDALKTLDEAARDAIMYRSRQLHLPGDDNKKLNDEMDQKAMSVYEAAIQRRGPHQAAQDAMQAGVGLPVDAAKRQAEIERREKESNAAMMQQSGNGSQVDILAGRQTTGADQRADQSFVDLSRPENNPVVPEGQGARIAAQAIASDDLRRAHPEAPLTHANISAYQSGTYEGPSDEERKAFEKRRAEGPSATAADKEAVKNEGDKPKSDDGNDGTQKATDAELKASNDAIDAQRKEQAVRDAQANLTNRPDLAQADREQIDNKQRMGEEGFPQNWGGGVEPVQQSHGDAGAYRPMTDEQKIAERQRTE